MANNPGGYPRELLDAADQLSKLVAADDGFDATMKRIAELAVLAIDGAEDCSISLARRRHGVIQTIAVTSDVGIRIDEVQQETGEGPCMSSIENHSTFHIPNMATDETWPRFSKRVVQETGIKSILSYVLLLSENETGAMSMLSTKVDAFPVEDIDTGTLFAAQAAVAMADALGHAHDREKIEQLEEGMKTRQMIGQATGILMAARGIDAEEAFDILKRISQNSNVKLRVIAERLAEKSREI